MLIFIIAGGSFDVVSANENVSNRNPAGKPVPVPANHSVPIANKKEPTKDTSITGTNSTDSMNAYNLLEASLKNTINDTKENSEHIKWVINIASIVVVLMIGVFGGIGLASLTDIKKEMATGLTAAREEFNLNDREIRKNLSKSLDSFKADYSTLTLRVDRALDELKSQHMELKKVMDEGIKSVSATREALRLEQASKLGELDTLGKELKSVQKELDLSFMSHLTLVSSFTYYQEARKLNDDAPRLRRARRYIDKVVELYKPKEPSLLRSAFHYRALVERRLIGAQEALQTLEAFLENNEDPDGVLHYNAACYACLLGQDEKWSPYLDKAIRKDSELRKDAAQDEDFKRVWEHPAFTKLTQ